MRRCTWLEPKLVCQIRFAEWTRDNHLRQPAFLGLREDKPPHEVVRERPADDSSRVATAVLPFQTSPCSHRFATLPAMTKVRLGIIGMGNIGQHHHGYLSAGKVSRAELVAVSDAIPVSSKNTSP